MLRILGRGTVSPDQMEKFTRYLDLVEKETSRCSQIVSNLLTFSRKSEKAFGPVAVADLMQRCVLLCQHKLQLSNIRLEQAIEADLPEIRGDFNQLQQCVINLIFNALDAMPDGGKITLHLQEHHDQVVIELEDTGTGFTDVL